MKIGIIGCGNMGQALLKGIITTGYVRGSDILCCDKDKKKINYLRSKLRVRVASSNNELVKKCDVIILAVKPQHVDAVSQDVATAFKGKLLISICAGITTKKLESHFGKVAVVRVMPNMPGQIMQGISAISLGRYATLRNKTVVRSIFSCIGEVVQVKEQLMDVVTAISGSGPAYFFYLTQRLIEVGKRMGLPYNIARKLAIKTALGSAMLMNQSRESAQELIQRVCSKGGTTEAALNVLRKKGLDKILAAALRAAKKRSRNLSKKGK